MKTFGSISETFILEPMFISGDTYVTGGTFNNSVLTLVRTDNVSVVISGFTGSTDIYTTGTTVDGPIVYFNRNDSMSAYTLDLSSITGDTFITGITYSNNEIILYRNDSIILNSFIHSFTGLTVTDLTANTIHATTYYGDGSHLTGISTTDTYVTGGTYTAGTAIFTNNTGGTFSVSGFSTGGTGFDIYTTGATYDNGFVYFDRTDILSAYTLNLTSLTGGTGANTFITGGTLNVNTLELFRNDNVQIDINLSDIRYSGGSAHCISDIYVTNVHGCSPITFHDLIIAISGLTVTGSIISDIISATTISATTYHGDGSQLNNIVDTLVTGGTFNQNTRIATFTNSTGGTFNVSGFNDIRVTGGTPNNNTKIYTFTNSTGGTFSVVGLTDISITGGTYSNSIGSAIFTNSTGGTFSVNGFFTGSTDIYSTGMTLNLSNYDLTVTRNDGNSFSTNLGALSSDVTITGGTYNQSSGVVTLTNNTGGTFSISGFTTGLTDTTISSFTYNANKLTIVDTTGGTFNVNINIVTGLTSTGLISTNTLSATTYQNLPIDIRVTGGTYSNGTSVFTNNTGGTFSVNGFFTGSTDVYITGGTISRTSNNTSILFTNSTGGTFTVSSIVDTFITGGTYSNGSAVFTNNSGATFQVSGFNTSVDTYVTGITNSNNVISLTNNTGGTISTLFNTLTGLTVNGVISTSTLSATTYQNLPIDIRVTGGTYNNGSLTFTNNTGGTFTTSGLFTGSTDVYVTGATGNNNIKTYTFTNSTGGTFSVVGLTDISITGVTFVNNLLSVNNNTGGTNTVFINTLTGLTVNGGLSATTITGTTVITTTQNTSDNSTKAATTAYVTTAINNAIAGVNPSVAVLAATTTSADTSSFTYNNGVGGVGATLIGIANVSFTVDGFTYTSVNQRVLIKNDTQSPSGAYNGVYFLSQLQTALLPPILTRSLDYNQPSDINSTGAIPVINGTANSDTSWLLTSSVNTIGTDSLSYINFTLNPTTIITNSTNAGGDLTGIYPNPTIKSSVGLSGNPTSTTPSNGNNSTQIATTAFVQNTILLLSADTYVTGFTYNNNLFTIKSNQGKSDLTLLVNTMTGLTVNGTLSAITVSSTTFGTTAATGSILFANNNIISDNVNRFKWDNINFGLLITSSGITSGSTYQLQSPVYVKVNDNNFYHYNIQNLSTGTSAASEFVVTPDNGALNSNFFAFGINNSGFVDAVNYSLYGGNSGYLLINGGDLNIGTQTAHNIIFHTSGVTLTKEAMRIKSNGNILIGGGSGTTDNGAKLQISGNTWISNGLTATTISATTFQNLPTIPYVTGFTYNSANLLTITNSTGGSYTVLVNQFTGISATTINTTTLNATGATITTLSATTLSATTIISGSTNINALFLSTQAFSGLTKITVGTISPVSPNIGDLWVDTN